MKHFFTVCIFLSIAFSCGHAQNWPNRFYTGVQYVRCNSDTTTYHNFPWYISAVDSSFSGWENWPTHDSLQWHILPDSRLDLVNELGANLAEFTIQPARMLPSTPGEFNIVSELNDRIGNRAAWGKPVTDMCITNFGLERYIAAERLMFHPETSDDFSSRGLFSADFELSFEDFPFDDATLDKQIGHLGDENNCISMNTSGQIKSLKRVRKREISFHQPHLSWTVSDNDTTAGKYHLSIVLKATEPITPTDDSAALKVNLYATDPGNPPAQQVVTFELPGNAFRDGTGNPVYSAFEYHLGLIELRIDSVNTMYPRVLNIRDWSSTQLPFQNSVASDTSSYNPPAITWRGDSLISAFDLEIEYPSSTSGIILVDAVCLTTPGTWAFYHPTDVTHTQAPFSGIRSTFDAYFNRMLEDASGDPHEYLRLIHGVEQTAERGAWRSSSIIKRFLQSETSGAVRLYTPLGAYHEPTASVVDIFRDGVSGYYHYPVHWSVPRPQDGLSNYFQDLYYSTQVKGFAFTSLRYRQFAKGRSDLGTAGDPWIPFIQNHSNMYPLNANWDEDPLREPTAAELCLQCNLALAYGADGVMFYQFSSAPYANADSACWPHTRVQFEQNPAYKDTAMGSLGFLGAGDRPRTVDMNGENKWDSARVSIAQMTSIGQYMKDSSFVWKAGRSWWYATDDAGDSEVVSNVFAQRQDNPIPIDPADSTLVETTEFESAGGTKYIFVVNGRTDSTGHRHICTKLKPPEVGTDSIEWKVTRILGDGDEGDIWIVRPDSNPDTTTISNGFTDYFKPGAAVLYRLDQIENETVSFNGECLGGSIYIEPEATMRTGSTDQLYFSSGHGLFAEGWLISQGSAFGPCDTEQLWEGIYSKGSDSVYLDNVSIINAAVVVGADGMAVLTEASEISGTKAALSLTDGELSSSSTESTDVMYHLWSYGDGVSDIDSDESNGSGQSGGAALYVTYGAECNVEESHFEDFYRGVYASDGAVYGDVDGSAPGAYGNNSFDCNRYGLSATRGGDIDLGSVISSPGDFAAKNEIILPDSSYAQAVTDASSVIYARQNWWEPVTQPPSVNSSGSVYYLDMLTSDPVPFTSQGGVLLSKSTSTSSPPSPPSGIRAQISAAARMSTTGTLRHLIGQFVSSTSATTAEYAQLRYVYRLAHKAGLTGCLDSLRTLCLTRQDVESKLLAADMCSRDKRYSDALDILNSYSFAASTALLTRSLVRKSILYPLARQGGYIDGLLALDTLSQFVSTDSSLLHFIHIYPSLYSGLSHPAQLSLTPKESHTRIMDQVIPDGIELGQNYPNPFRDVTSFTFKLGEQTHVRLSVYDAMGREVAVVTDTEYGRGVHSAILRSAHLPSGLYFYRFMTTKGVIQRKMMLVR